MACQFCTRSLPLTSRRSSASPALGMPALRLVSQTRSSGVVRFASHSSRTARRGGSKSVQPTSQATLTPAPRPGPPSATRVAPAAVAPAAAAPVPSRILYRGPSGYRSWIYVFSGLSFGTAGVVIGLAVHDSLSWPIFSWDPNVRPELVNENIRRVAGFGVGILGLGFFWLFMVVPTHSVTRLTLHPSTRTLTLRTALPSFPSIIPRALIPRDMLASLRSRGFHQPGSSRSERTLPISEVWRIDGSAAEGGRSSGAKNLIFLRLGNARLAYSLLASSPAKDSWSWRLRGPTDWSLVEGVVGGQPLQPPAGLSKTDESKWRLSPWFQDRQLLDRLIPNERKKPKA